MNLTGHIFRIDGRIEMMKNIILSLQPQFDEVKEICKNDKFVYWDMIYADDTEHLVGIVFVVLQNYINSSISDLYPELPKVFSKYLIDKKVKDSEITRIQLIMAVANYYKHRDLPTELGANITKPFNELGIKYIQFASEDSGQNKKYYSHNVGADSPVFNGFGILSEEWDFNDLIDIVVEWRENMWLLEEQNLKTKS